MGGRPPPPQLPLPLWGGGLQGLQLCFCSASHQPTLWLMRMSRLTLPALLSSFCVVRF